MDHATASRARAASPAAGRRMSEPSSPGHEVRQVVAPAPAACACGGGCPRCRGSALQRKPTVSTPGDRHEQEADDIADRIMRTPTPTRVSPSVSRLQRQCAACEEEDAQRDRTIQREAAFDAAAAAATRGSEGPGARGLDIDTAERAAKQGGSPLPDDLRGFFEPRLGHDLGDVRVHADGTAARGADAVQARAFTLGNDIVFGAGEYEPGSAAGQRLLAHELVHVVQQAGGGREVQRTLQVDTTHKDSIDEKTALSTVGALVTTLCPDFELKGKTVDAKKGTDCASFKFDAVAASKQKVGCCCLCTLAKGPGSPWRIVITTQDAPTTSDKDRLVRMTPTSGPDAPALAYWTGGKTPKVQDLQPVEAFGHELCGHAALMQIKAHAGRGTDRAYDDQHDSTVRIQNALAGEMGMPGDRRGLAADGAHRGESLRIFTVGPYKPDADDPAPFAAQIKSAVGFLDGNPLLLVDEVGMRDKADTKATVSKSRADKVETQLRAAIATDTVDVETTPGKNETLTRVQAATDGGVGAKPVVELRMAIRPAGLVKPPGAAPPAKPVHVDPENPAVVKALKGKGANPCHALLSSTGWP